MDIVRRLNVGYFNFYRVQPLKQIEPVGEKKLFIYSKILYTIFKVHFLCYN